MRQQYHLREVDGDLYAWDVFELIRLAEGLEVRETPLSSFPEIDEEYWYEVGGARPTCRDIIKHAQLINDADLSYPILLCKDGRVMDGMHRLCKASMLGHKSIKAKVFSSDVEPSYINVHPSELNYQKESK